MKSIFKLFIISCLLIISIQSCSNKHLEKRTVSANWTLADSINHDNKIYQPGTKLVFDYYIIENGDTFKTFLLNDMPNLLGSHWSFVRMDSLSHAPQDFLIDKINITVLETPFVSSQTHIQYDYIAANKDLLTTTWSGLIEDKNRIWWHPIRTFYLHATQFSPFPEIRFPSRKNTTWKGKITDGKSTSTLEWFDDFEGYLLEINSDYTITGKEKIQTVFGELNCTVIDATAITKFSKTTLKSYFHEKYGFVRWDYFNVDNKRLVFDLVERQESELVSKF